MSVTGGDRGRTAVVHTGRPKERDGGGRGKGEGGRRELHGWATRGSAERARPTGRATDRTSRPTGDEEEEEEEEEQEEEEEEAEEEEEEEEEEERIPDQSDRRGTRKRRRRRRSSRRQRRRSDENPTELQTK